MTDRRSGQLRVNRYHAGLWDELVDLGVVERQSASWQQSIGGLLEIDEIPLPDLPVGLEAELRPYQHDGYAWLCFLVDHGLGGILADDMGLGKTVQTLAMIARQVERNSGAVPGGRPDQRRRQLGSGGCSVRARTHRRHHHPVARPAAGRPE